MIKHAHEKFKRIQKHANPFFKWCSRVKILSLRFIYKICLSETRVQLNINQVISVTRFKTALNMKGGEYQRVKRSNLY